MLNRESKVLADKIICDFACVHVKALKEVDVRKRLDGSEVPEGYLAMLTFGPHILYKLCTYLG